MSTFAEKISSLKKLYKNQLKGNVLLFLKKNSIDKQYVGFFTNLDRAMDFSKPEDCIEACKWYIDRFLERSKNLKLFWIPYWRAVGFDNWKTDKFDDYCPKEKDETSQRIGKILSNYEHNF